MRRALIGFLTLAVALVAAAAAPARVGDDETRPLALHTMKENVGDAIKLETDAVRLLKAGNVKGADQEIANSKELLDGAMGAAESLTPPSEMDRFVPTWPENKNWAGLAHTMRLAYGGDAAALLTGSVSQKIEEVSNALVRKTAIYQLVNDELTKPMCGLLVNVEPQPSVNGTTLAGGTQVEINASCPQTKLKDIVVLTPGAAIKEIVAGNPKEQAVMKGKVIEVIANGQTSGGVQMIVDPNPPEGSPIDVTIIPQAAKRLAEFFDERF
ncbi:MAG TPA: hypothetical protein VFB25_06315 [Gaiellaceae bacterium]|nr:hypothetical protein [Gaiellaceae bacterium]